MPLPSPLASPLADLWAFVKLLLKRFNETRCPQVAGSLAFTTLLSLVPLLTVTVAMFGRFPGFSQLGAALKGFLLTNLLPDKAGKIIATYALQFSEKATNLTLIGTALLVASAFMLLLTIEGVFNQIWGVRRPRRLVTRITVYWLALSLGPVALGVCAFATSYFISLSMGLVSSSAWLRELSLQIASLLLLSGFFALTYFAIPNCPVRGKYALTGGILAGALFLGMQQVFGHYVAKLPTYTLVYGTFAALPIFLAWLYSSWLVVLLGALVTATLPGFIERTRVQEPYAGIHAMAAVHLLETLNRAHQHGRGLAIETLYPVTALGAAATEQLLELLRDAHWLTRDEQGNWHLARPIASLHLSDVVARLALSPAAMSRSDARPLTRTVADRLEAGLRAEDIRLDALFEAPPHSE